MHYWLRYGFAIKLFFIMMQYTTCIGLDLAPLGCKRTICSSDHDHTFGLQRTRGSFLLLLRLVARCWWRQLLRQGLMTTTASAVWVYQAPLINRGQDSAQNRFSLKTLNAGVYNRSPTTYPCLYNHCFAGWFQFKRFAAYFLNVCQCRHASIVQAHCSCTARADQVPFHCLYRKECR